jgi:hypothetical protein
MNFKSIITVTGLALLGTIFSGTVLAESTSVTNPEKAATAPPVLAAKPAACQVSSETSKAKDATVQTADCTFLSATCFENPDGSHCCYVHYTCRDFKTGSCGRAVSSLGIDGKDPRPERPHAAGGLAAF